jgi:diacylglycerol kinase family enzyme
LARVLILCNPIAGGGRGARAAAALHAALARLGVAAELVVTATRGEARQRAAELRAEQCSAVAVVGGDGTVNEVLNGLADPRIGLAQLPLGTANVLACELRLPRRPAALARLLASGTPVPVATGRCNGRRFLLFTSAGFDAAIVHRLEQVRLGTLGKLRWTGPILHTVWRWPLRSLTVRADDGFACDDATEVLVTRVRNYGGVLRMPAGDLRDQALHLLVFRQRTRRQYAAAAVRALLGRLRTGRDVEHRAVRQVTIEADPPAPVQLDGEAAGTTPVQVAIDAQSVLLFAATLPAR